MWHPDPATVEAANVTRLMRRCGAADLDALRRWSVEDVARFWDAVVADLAIPFARPYEQVLDVSGGIEWATWFAGGEINIASACVDRWAADPARAAHPAVVAESEDGTVRTMSYAELAREVDRVAAGLQARGVGAGDVVAVFMPMVAEAVVATYAIAKLGAIYLPVFSGFGAPAIAARLRDAGAVAVVTADATWRRGRHGRMKGELDAALRELPDVHTVVVLDHLGTAPAMEPGRDVDWAALAPSIDRSLPAAPTDSEAPFMLAYTSGTTGPPKGAVHVHGGFLVKVASEAAYQFDVKSDDVVMWVTDMGWIMGIYTTIAAHAHGATMVMYEGAPDFPAPDRLWQVAAAHRVSILGVSPTLVRALMPHGSEPVQRHDLGAIRIFGSTGEPWNDGPYRWLLNDVGGGRVPIINVSGGTEVGGSFLSPYPVEPLKACSLGGPSLGMDMDVLDADGRPLRDGVGELVCRQPWPSMTRGVWNDRERYLRSYWSTYPGIWRHGDWATVDADGQWFLSGRSDDALNVAGKRVGPAEVESVLVEHAAVAEAAVVGVPDATKGEAIWAFWTATDPAADDASAELATLVAERLGKPFKPGRVTRVGALPRTRSAKILRRAIRATALGEDPGDLSTAENPESLDGIRAALAAG